MRKNLIIVFLVIISLITFALESTACNSGRSAYDIYVDAFVETNGSLDGVLSEEEWLLSLKGDCGAQGEKGEQGKQGEKGEQGERGDSEFQYLVNSVNHRGYYTAPENTLAAFRESRKNGFTMVECDVSFTKDGYAVLLHDTTVDRTSNGTGEISSLTLEEVRTLDFGSWKSPAYAGEKIPTFEEFILLCRNISIHPYIEVKSVTLDQVKSLVNTVIKLGMKDNVTWISFTKNNLRSILEVDSTARVGYLVDEMTTQAIHDAVDLRTDKNKVFVNCNYYNVNSETIAMCIDALLPLEVWTVDSEQEILNLNPYISGVTSNRLIAGKVLYENAIN